MTARRSVLAFLGLATAASFAAGWFVAAAAKPTPIQRTPLAPEPQPETPPTPTPTQTQFVSASASKDDTFEKKILPFVKKYCIECHNADKAGGGLAIDGYKTESLARKGRKDWMAMQEQIQSSMMPPKKRMLQPTKDEREFVVKWIEESLTKVDCGLAKDPGRVTIRRLNRAEYNNTVRDLCGVDFKPADDFPADDVGYGFDNIGDVLSFQPILMEKYMAAAEKVLNEAIQIPASPAKDLQKRFPQQITTRPGTAKSRDNKIVFTTEGFAQLPERFNFPAEGEYIIRFRGWGTGVGGKFPQVAIRLDDVDLKTVTVDAPETKPGTYETRGKFTAGGKKVVLGFTNGSEDKDPEKRKFGLIEIQIEGPFNPVPKAPPESTRLVLGTIPTKDMRESAEKTLSNFARRAYRRPVKPDEVQRLMKLYDIAAKDEPYERAIRLPMKAVLCSPHFLYRIEDDPKSPDDVRTLNDFEFATRLSYFLWSSMPDEELFRLAADGTLRKPDVLEAQVRRMLKDAKVRSLSENFAGQWLMLRNIRTLAPDKGYFPKWDDDLKNGMIGEAEAFFEYVVQNDRPILDFIDADYTLVNGRMAEHYGIKDVYGKSFKKVQLPDGKRGGVITMASTLTVTSNPTRTSPVKRGKWILENILGTPPPPPAPDVPELPPTGQLKGTLRQQMEQHRENPTCAVCHAKLDPLGFGLENFDGIGGWRTTDNKKDIDSSGVLPGGEKFSGPAELRKVLLGKSDQFRNCFAEKVLTFALGRGLEYYDKCAVDEIVKAGKSGGDRFAAYVLAVVKSDPFQNRKGKRSE
ncbi:MAG: DUF1592 domain-containing protein [Gemmataceae bacterium]